MGKNKKQLSLMKNKYGKYTIAYDAIKTLAEAYDKKDYFKLIVLAPLVFEQITIEIAENLDGYEEDKMAEDSYKEHKEIQNLYQRILQPSSIKARSVSAILDLYYQPCDEAWIDCKQFKRFFTKIENMFSLRNILVHDFFKKDISAERIKRTSIECFEIIDILLKHPFAQ